MASSQGSAKDPPEESPTPSGLGSLRVGLALCVGLLCAAAIVLTATHRQRSAELPQRALTAVVQVSGTAPPPAVEASPLTTAERAKSQRRKSSPQNQPSTTAQASDGSVKSLLSWRSDLSKCEFAASISTSTPPAVSQDEPVLSLPTSLPLAVSEDAVAAVRQHFTPTRSATESDTVPETAVSIAKRRRVAKKADAAFATRLRFPLVRDTCVGAVILTPPTDGKAQATGTCPESQLPRGVGAAWTSEIRRWLTATAGGAAFHAVASVTPSLSGDSPGGGGGNATEPSLVSASAVFNATTCQYALLFEARTEGRGFIDVFVTQRRFDAFLPELSKRRRMLFLPVARLPFSCTTPRPRPVAESPCLCYVTAAAPPGRWVSRSVDDIQRLAALDPSKVPAPTADTNSPEATAEALHRHPALASFPWHGWRRRYVADRQSCDAPEFTAKRRALWVEGCAATIAATAASKTEVPPSSGGSTAAKAARHWVFVGDSQLRTLYHQLKKYMTNDPAVVPSKFRGNTFVAPGTAGALRLSFKWDPFLHWLTHDGPRAQFVPDPGGDAPDLVVFSFGAWSARAWNWTLPSFAERVDAAIKAIRTATANDKTGRRATKFLWSGIPAWPRKRSARTDSKARITDYRMGAQAAVARDALRRAGLPSIDFFGMTVAAEGFSAGDGMHYTDGAAMMALADAVLHFACSTL